MKETSKIIIQVESEFHKMLKMKALEKDMTLKELIIKAVKEFLEKDLKNEKENNQFLFMKDVIAKIKTDILQWRIEGYKSEFTEIKEILNFQKT